MSDELRRTNTELEAILSSIADGLVVNDMQGRVTRISATAHALLRYTDEERQRPINERLPRKMQLFRADGRPYGYEEYPPVRALNGETVRGEEMMMRTEGAPDRNVWVLASAAPIRTAEGESLGAVTILTDITSLRETRAGLEVANAVLREQGEQLRRQADALREAAEGLEQRVRERTASLERATRELGELARQQAADRRFLATIMDNVPAVIAYLDDRLICLQCNVAAARKLGVPADDAVGRHLRKLAPGNPDLWAAIEGVLRTGKPFRSPVLEVRQRTRAGGERVSYYMAAFLPDIDETGSVRGVFAEGQDVTEMIETRRRLESAQAELQALSRRLAQLQEEERSYVADQLYNQAAQVYAALGMRLRALERNGAEDWTEELAEIRNGLSAAMLALHDLATRLRPAGLDRAPLPELLQDYLGQWAQAHAIAFEFDNTLPEDAALSMAARTAVFRVVQEAAANIAQHARATQVRAEVRVAEGALLISLADNGIGFDVAGRHEGGAGLAAMRERIQSVGGELRITSSIAGTRLEITLPSTRAADSSSRPPGRGGGAGMRQMSAVGRL